MTPSYFYEEMDIFDLNKAISCMDPKAYLECFPEAARNERQGSIDRAARLGVITKDRT